MNIEQLLDKAFKGKKRDSGEEYFNHCKRVRDACVECLVASNTIEPVTNLEKQVEIISIIALAHDFVEDIGSSTDLFHLLSDSEDWEKLTPEEVSVIMTSVMLLSRREKESYFDFIVRISKGSTIANVVKIFDLEDNMKDSKEGSRLDKYRFAHEYLIEKMKK